MSQLVYRSEYCQSFQQESESLEEAERLDLLANYTRTLLTDYSIKYDALVIDEGQDLMREPFLSLLDDLLIGGLKTGCWSIFGDFSQQLLFDKNVRIENLKELTGNFTLSKLRKNCRNTRQIASSALGLLNLPEDLYRGGFTNGPEVEFLFYKRSDDEVKILNNAVTNLLSRGVNLSDIIILSPRKFSNSALSGEEKIGSYQILDISNADEPLKAGEFIRFSTVAAFKGLESTAVIVIDVETFSRKENEHLLYVALTRPRGHLTVVTSDKNHEFVNSNYRSMQGKLRADTRS